MKQKKSKRQHYVGGRLVTQIFSPTALPMYIKELLQPIQAPVADKSDGHMSESDDEMEDTPQANKKSVFKTLPVKRPTIMQAAGLVDKPLTMKDLKKQKESDSARDILEKAFSNMKIGHVLKPKHKQVSQEPSQHKISGGGIRFI